LETVLVAWPLDEVALQEHWLKKSMKNPDPVAVPVPLEEVVA
jgi:hypothetical protein